MDKKDKQEKDSSLTRKRKCGQLRGKIMIPSNFDAPLPKEILNSFYEATIFPK